MKVYSAQNSCLADGYVSDFVGHPVSFVSPHLVFCHVERSSHFAVIWDEAFLSCHPLSPSSPPSFYVEMENLSHWSLGVSIIRYPQARRRSTYQGAHYLLLVEQSFNICCLSHLREFTLKVNEGKAKKKKTTPIPPPPCLQRMLVVVVKMARYFHSIKGSVEGKEWRREMGHGRRTGRRRTRAILVTCFLSGFV